MTTTPPILNGLVHHWGFQADSGADEVGSLHLTAVNAPSYENISTYPRNGRAVILASASTQYFRSGANAAPPTGEGQPFTIAGWVRFTSATGTRSIICFTNEGGDPSSEIWAHIYRSSGNIVFDKILGDLSGVAQVVAGAGVVINVWYLVVARYDPAKSLDTVNTMHLWVKAENSLAAPVEAEDEYDDLYHPSNVECFLGAKNAGQQILNGRLDEVGIWDRVLSDEEILVLFNAGRGSTRGNLAAARDLDASGPVHNGRALRPVFDAFDRLDRRVLIDLEGDSNLVRYTTSSYYGWWHALMTFLDEDWEIPCFGTSFYGAGYGNGSNATQAQTAGIKEGPYGRAANVANLRTDHPTLPCPANTAAVAGADGSISANTDPSFLLPYYRTTDLAGSNDFGLMMFDSHIAGVANDFEAYVWVGETDQASPFTVLIRRNAGGYGTEAEISITPSLIATGAKYQKFTGAIAANGARTVGFQMLWPKNGTTMTAGAGANAVVVYGLGFQRPHSSLGHGFAIMGSYARGGVGLFDQVNPDVSSPDEWIDFLLDVRADLAGEHGVILFVYMPTRSNDANDTTVQAHGSAFLSSTGEGFRDNCIARIERIRDRAAAKGMTQTIRHLVIAGPAHHTSPGEAEFDEVITEIGAYARSTKDVCFLDGAHSDILTLEERAAAFDYTSTGNSSADRFHFAPSGYAMYTEKWWTALREASVRPAEGSVVSSTLRRIVHALYSPRVR